MTTQSTTILVDGTPDRDFTSEATSVDGTDDSLTPSARRGHNLEELFGGMDPRPEQQYPTAASLNASLDRLPLVDHCDGLHPPAPQHHSDGQNDSATPPQTDGDYHHHDDAEQHSSNQGPPPTNLAQPSPPAQPSPDTPMLDGASPHTPPPPTPQPSAAQPAAADTNPSSTNSSNTMIQPPAANPQTQHRRRRRQRLLRWLQRRLDHPLPWRLDLRGRTENIRRRIRDVDHVLP